MWKKLVFLGAFCAICYGAAEAQDDFPMVLPGGSIDPPFPSRPLAGVPQLGGGQGQGVAPESHFLQVPNHKGDRVVVRWTTRWWNFGDVLLGMFSNGDNGDMTWTDGRSFQGMCLFSCDFDFTASADNVTVWAEYRGCGECFGGDIQLISVTAPVSPGVSQQTRDEAARYAGQFRDATAYFGALATVAKGCVAISADPICALIAALATTAAAGSALAAVRENHIANDPCNGCDFWNIYSPPLSSPDDLGLAYCGGTDPFGDGVVPWACNSLVEETRYIDRDGDGAGESADRASGCDAAGASCVDYQVATMRWYLGDMGSHMQNAAWYLSLLWQEFSGTWADVYSSDCGCSLSDALAKGSSAYWDSGNYYAGNYQ